MEKVKLSLYRPGQAPRTQEVEASWISRQIALEGAKVVSRTHHHIYLQEIFLVLISVRG